MKRPWLKMDHDFRGKRRLLHTKTDTTKLKTRATVPIYLVREVHGAFGLPLLPLLTAHSLPLKVVINDPCDSTKAFFIT